MTISRNCFDKVSALAFMGAWGTAAASGIATAAWIEPATGSLIASTALLSHVAGNRGQKYEKTIRRLRNTCQGDFYRWTAAVADDAPQARAEYQFRRDDAL